MKNAVHFGAGNIGRGFIGLLLSKAGYHVTFIDIIDQLVDDINNLGKYNVQIAGSSEKILVDNISAIDSDRDDVAVDAVVDAIAEADIVTTAIGPNSLKYIASNLAEGLKKRIATNKKPLNVIACENMFGSSTTLKNFVYAKLTDEVKNELDKLVGFPDAAVDRIVPDQPYGEKLMVTVEEFAEWDVDSRGVIGDLSQIKGLTLVDNLNAYIDRKIFTVNTGHAAIAYLAYQRGINDIANAIHVNEILQTARDVWAETSALLIAKYRFAPASHRRYVEQVEKRFSNAYLSDEVIRVGRNPKRKLAPEDRIIYPANQLATHDINPEALGKVAAAAFKFDYDGDTEAVEIQNYILANGIDAAITHFTGVTPGSRLFYIIKKNF
ncbi:MAG: mannitol-1-phosphate 5-dehydrogenase [Selenomonadaceae bacterium]|nr:mannitol-1-phosphate 5-dehydrogenase [Selenomonadaceae bacterium]